MLGFIFHGVNPLKQLRGLIKAHPKLYGQNGLLVCSMQKASKSYKNIFPSPHFFSIQGLQMSFVKVGREMQVSEGNSSFKGRKLLVQYSV